MRFDLHQTNTVLRIRLWYGALLLVLAVFIVRLFYLQVIRHDYYRQAALSNQLKQYEIPAERGAILAHYGDKVLPIVLNEVKFTLYADPKYIENADNDALVLAGLTGGEANEYKQKMLTEGSRYQILKRCLSKEQSEKILELKLKGVGTQPANYRTYPQGDLAAQVLGFVNQEGVANYGIEQALNEELSGKDGQLKAITDASGVPLAANQDNIIENPVAGRDVVLTLDVNMQSQLEDILKAGLKRARSKSGGALILDAKTGAVRAMANYPTYKPAEYFKQQDASVFNNATVSKPLEIGSVMKPFTAAAAVNLGVVSPSTTYYDPSVYSVDGYKITNIEEDGGAATRSVSDILRYSLNTGATWLLMQMGGGELNERGRVVWHKYMTDHFQFGKLTGIEQGYEAPGTIPSPTEGYGLNLRFANTSFGQGMTATPLQVGAALASVVNGGKYHRPHLVEAYVNPDGTTETQEPQLVKGDVVSPKTSRQVIDMMENVVNNNYIFYHMDKPPEGFSVGGKTGTAEIANPEGGYFEDRYNGTFMGFVGGDEPEYVIVVRVDEPKIPGYAGSQAAAPIFGQLVFMLINNFNVAPAS